MSTLSLNEYWKSTLRPDHLARRRAMIRTLQLQTLAGILSLVAVPVQPLNQDALPALPADRPTGILS
jgi:hypothetical protein